MAKDKFFKAVFAVAALAVAVTIVYHYLVYIPRRDKALAAAQEEQIRVEEQLQAQTGACLKEADAAYLVACNDKCRKLGKKSGCRLSPAAQVEMEKIHTQLRGNCSQRYAP